MLRQTSFFPAKDVPLALAKKVSPLKQIYYIKKTPNKQNQNKQTKAPQNKKTQTI